MNNGKDIRSIRGPLRGLKAKPLTFQRKVKTKTQNQMNQRRRKRQDLLRKKEEVQKEKQKEVL